ncbi:hypothetical protein Tco_1047694 [Tanacetum coccineum]
MSKKKRVQYVEDESCTKNEKKEEENLNAQEKKNEVDFTSFRLEDLYHQSSMNEKFTSSEWYNCYENTKEDNNQFQNKDFMLENNDADMIVGTLSDNTLRNETNREETQIHSLTTNVEKILRVETKAEYTTNIDYLLPKCLSMIEDVMEELFKAGIEKAALKLDIETLEYEQELYSQVINNFVTILNYEEKMTSKKFLRRHFFNTIMMSEEMQKLKNDQKAQIELFHTYAVEQFEKKHSNICMKEIELTGSAVIINNSDTDIEYEAKYNETFEFVLKVMSDRYLTKILLHELNEHKIKIKRIAAKWIADNEDEIEEEGTEAKKEALKR